MWPQRACDVPWARPAACRLCQVLMAERSAEDEVLVLASDGLWDVIGNQEAADMAAHSLAVSGGKGEMGAWEACCSI